jgi:hypothetical protein
METDINLEYCRVVITENVRHEILKILLHIITMLICVLNGKVFHIITELLKQIMCFFCVWTDDSTYLRLVVCI